MAGWELTKRMALHVIAALAITVVVNAENLICNGDMDMPKISGRHVNWEQWQFDMVEGGVRHLEPREYNPEYVMCPGWTNLKNMTLVLTADEAGGPAHGGPPPQQALQFFVWNSDPASKGQYMEVDVRSAVDEIATDRPIKTVPGQTYLLSFDAKKAVGYDDEKFLVKFGPTNLVEEVSPDAPGMNGFGGWTFRGPTVIPPTPSPEEWKTFSVQVVGSGSDILVFTEPSNQNDRYGIFIDSVCLCSDADKNGVCDTPCDSSDPDGDGFVDACDSNPAVYNPNQLDIDGRRDGSFDATLCTGADRDGDGIPDVCDNCPYTENANQVDDDLDGIGDACDNCWGSFNPMQFDAAWHTAKGGDVGCGSGKGDACDEWAFPPEEFGWKAPPMGHPSFWGPYFCTGNLPEVPEGLVKLELTQNFNEVWSLPGKKLVDQLVGSSNKHVPEFQQTCAVVEVLFVHGMQEVTGFGVYRGKESDSPVTSYGVEFWDGKEYVQSTGTIAATSGGNNITQLKQAISTCQARFTVCSDKSSVQVGELYIFGNPSHQTKLAGCEERETCGNGRCSFYYGEGGFGSCYEDCGRFEPLSLITDFVDDPLAYKPERLVDQIEKIDSDSWFRYNLDKTGMQCVDVEVVTASGKAVEITGVGVLADVSGWRLDRFSAELWDDATGQYYSVGVKDYGISASGFNVAEIYPTFAKRAKFTLCQKYGLIEVSEIILKVRSECGDGNCGQGETCYNCPVDCGACGAVCGDGRCTQGETCSTCLADCGACPPVCGDGNCTEGETCSTCAADCGACLCGDGSCTEGETCSTCAADCGACPSVCGDGSCTQGETCSTCAADCGACPSVCGDGSCTQGETSAICPQDCGATEVAPDGAVNLGSDDGDDSDDPYNLRGYTTSGGAHVNQSTLLVLMVCLFSLVNF